MSSVLGEDSSLAVGFYFSVDLGTEMVEKVEIVLTEVVESKVVVLCSIDFLAKDFDLVFELGPFEP